MTREPGHATTQVKPSASPTTRATRTRAFGWGLGVVLAAVFGQAEIAHARVCLPPIFEGGKRLVHNAVQIAWLEPLLRQHEVCWREPRTPGEKRVFVLGNSGILGFPHASGDGVVGMLNDRFARGGVPAHLYNLAYVMSYQIKDALILRESLEHRPDVIVQAIMLEDLVHVAPMQFSALWAFFDANSVAVARMAEEEPGGLAEPFDLYRRAQQRRGVRQQAGWRRLKQSGEWVRIAVREWARSLRYWLFPEMPFNERKREPLQYVCEEVIERERTWYADWQTWNYLEYLSQVQDETGAEIVIVSWPAAYDPRSVCRNMRYTWRTHRIYQRWIREEASDRGFHLVDLDPIFPQDEFIDSSHLSVAGQRFVADRLESVLRPLLEANPQQTREQSGAP